MLPIGQDVSIVVVEADVAEQWACLSMVLPTVRLLFVCEQADEAWCRESKLLGMREGTNAMQ
jgi:hypothetical protein